MLFSFGRFYESELIVAKLLFLNRRKRGGGRRVRIFPKVTIGVFVIFRKSRGDETDKSLKCEQCAEPFSFSDELENHLKLHSEGKLLSCSQCSKSFSNLRNLSRHMKVHNIDTGKSFSCVQCTKSFAKEIYLRNHLKVHTGEKPFSCPQCSKTFVNKITNT